MGQECRFEVGTKRILARITAVLSQGQKAFRGRSSGALPRK